MELHNREGSDSEDIPFSIALSYLEQFLNFNRHIPHYPNLRPYLHWMDFVISTVANEKSGECAACRRLLLSSESLVLP